QKFADRRDVGLAVGTVEALRHVEHEVRAGEGDFLREGEVGFETDDVAEETQSLLHRLNGGAIIPLDECVAAGARWVVETAVGVGFLVVRETDAHVVSGDLLQKRPRPRRSEPTTTRCWIPRYERKARCAIGRSRNFFSDV